ncbi:MAG: alkaline phosphatase family protein [Candidatus Electrothrix aestuarii]|uniref:Alkaline phosphatase family protein n=1 Tax=Candidatus Electrothrix aestuarii TaxID=3062594 RepID=A0AAU8LYM8_9BACT|nr:alkaline phosphatase family protein [Candidatus Electrothrix aestuarii]
MSTHRSAERCLLILLDGLGDRAYPELGNRTPLQAAHTPNLNVFAQSGSCGLLHAGRPGIALPSENAHFALFGYQEQEFPGRGLFEALGADLDIRPGDIAFLIHFGAAEVRERTLILKKHRPQTSAEETRAFIEAIASYTWYGKDDDETEPVQIDYLPTKDLEGILRLRGKGLSRQVTDTSPPQHDHPLLMALPYRKTEDPIAAQRTAAALNSYIAWSHTTLSKHPLNLKRQKNKQELVNILVTQRPGTLGQIQPFAERWGIQGASLSSGLMYWGLASYLGMRVEKVKDSDDPGRDLAERLAQAVSLGKEYEFIHVHTKAPDAAAHTKDPKKKVAAIESLDKGIGQMLPNLLDGRTVVIITADHSTPSAGPQIHSGEPVPITVVGPGIRHDLVTGFDEVQCAPGALGWVQGRDLMPMVLNFLDRAKLVGLMDTPDDQPYWPGKRVPFQL